MGGRTTYRPDAELSEDDRLRINSARAVLREYGLNPQPDMPEPLSELGYEQRMARGRALELAIQFFNQGGQVNSITLAANQFYRFIWEGKHDDAV